jgi:hypothetical protein
MEPVVRILNLHDEKFELIRDPQESLDIFAAILERGRWFFPEASVEQGPRRVCRVVRLKHSDRKDQLMARDYILRIIEQIATMLAALMSRRKAGEIIQAREDLENHCVRTIGFTLSEIKLLSPEEVAPILEKSGALRITRALILAELLILDAQWHEEDRSAEDRMPNYVHALCLIADSLESLSTEEQTVFRAKLATLTEKIGPLREHPYIAERISKYAVDCAA